jgi:phage tail tape-measure protein
MKGIIEFIEAMFILLLIAVLGGCASTGGNPEATGTSVSVWVNTHQVYEFSRKAGALDLLTGDPNLTIDVKATDDGTSGGQTTQALTVAGKDSGNLVKLAGIIAGAAIGSSAGVPGIAAGTLLGGVGGAALEKWTSPSVPTVLLMAPIPTPTPKPVNLVK